MNKIEAIIAAGLLALTGCTTVKEIKKTDISLKTKIAYIEENNEYTITENNSDKKEMTIKYEQNKIEFMIEGKYNMRIEIKIPETDTKNLEKITEIIDRQKKDLENKLLLTRIIQYKTDTNVEFLHYDSNKNEIYLYMSAKPQKFAEIETRLAENTTKIAYAKIDLELKIKYKNGIEELVQIYSGKDKKEEQEYLLKIELNNFKVRQIFY